MRTKRLVEHLPLIFLVLLFITFFYRQIVFGEVLYCCDNLLINIPAKLFWVQEILQGKFPLGNPYLFSGTPFLADINLSPLYPGNLLFLLLSPFRALTVSVIVHIFIVATGMYWASMKLGYSKQASLVSAVVFTFSGTVVEYTGNLPMIQVVSFVPWLFGAWHLFILKPSKKSMKYVLLFSVLQIFAGHVQLTFYTFLLCFSYGLLFLNQPLLRRIVTVGKIGVFILLVSGIQLIPFFDFAQHTTRIGQGFSYAIFGALPLTAVFRIIFPSITGNIQIGTDWWQGGSVFGYLGVLPLVFAVFSGFIRTKRTVFLGVVGSISFLAAFGASTPVFPLLYGVIPGIGMFRVPSHFLLIFTFSFAILSAHGFMTMYQLDQKKKRDIARILLAVSCLCLVAWISLLLGGNDILVSFLSALDNAKWQAKFATMKPEGLRLVIHDITQNIGIVGISLFLLNVSVRRVRTFTWIGIIAIIFIDFFIFSRKNLLAVPYQQITTWNQKQAALVSELTMHMIPGYRVYFHPELYASPYAREFGKNWMVNEIRWQMESLRPNMLMNYSIPLVNGYASMIDGRYQQRFEVRGQDPTGVVIPDTAVDQLRSIGGRYILARAGTNAESPVFSESKILWSNAQISLRELSDVVPVQRYDTGHQTTMFSIGIIVTLVGIIGFVVLPERWV